jgi:hypothetical protein
MREVPANLGSMDAILPLFFRWLHLCSIAVLVGGIVYARFIAEDLAPRFKLLAYGAIGAILISGTYNLLSKSSYPPHYHAWFGIKVVLALHVFGVTILYRGKLRMLTGAVIVSAVIIALSGYLRWISLT